MKDVDLTDTQFSYSAIMRKLRKCDDDVVNYFLATYKFIFDTLTKHHVKNIVETALSITLNKLIKKYKVRIK